MSRLATVVASRTRGIAAEAQCRAVGLNVTKSLAMVALLGLSSSGKWAAIGLMTGLLAYLWFVKKNALDGAIRPAQRGQTYSCSRGALQMSKLLRSGPRCRIYSKLDEREKTFW